MVWRDLQLAEDTGCPLHLLHLSTRTSVAMVVAARAAGVPVSFEIAPHHFTLDESACAEFDPRYKVHPPLRTAVDVAALRAALVAGEVDAVATDHAPHAPQLKDLPFDEAPPGMLGLETAAALTLDVLGDDAVTFFRVLSRRPAQIAQVSVGDDAAQGEHGGDVRPGEQANLVVFDPAATSVVDETTLQSKSLNTPYQGMTLRGCARHLLVDGRLTVVDRELS
jgi:dihydroorotase